MHFHQWKRREFITLLGGAVVAWPLGARAQQGGRMRRIGILMPYPKSDTDVQARIQAFRQELRKLGWTQGGNVELDERWTGDDMALVRANAASLVQSKPDLLLAVGGRVIPILMQMTRSIPIVVPGSGDPVSAGYAHSLARPGGNITGFSIIELSVIGKMLETLKQIAPSLARVAVIHNPDNPNAALYARSAETSGATLAIQTVIVTVRGLADIERAVESFSEQGDGGVLIPPDVTITTLREPVINLLARRRLPAIYSDRVLATNGGLVTYSVDRIDLHRSAASYVDRILRGEKPGDLPYQLPTRYELVINLKTAKALGIEVPPTLLARADEVIE
jgi:putative tryptophan/tyrosine transport system substrate-binding protein